MPHLDAAHNLARWMTRTEHDAQDVVQEASLRALRFFDGFRGGDSRSWILAIVRNTCHTWLQRNRMNEPAALDVDRHDAASEDADPQALLLRRAGGETVRQAIEGLAPEFREIIVLREMEGLSYKQIAQVAGLPIGTVMSRLARARERLQKCLAEDAPQEAGSCP